MCSAGQALSCNWDGGHLQARTNQEDSAINMSKYKHDGQEQRHWRPLAVGPWATSNFSVSHLHVYITGAIIAPLSLSCKDYMNKDIKSMLNRA